MSGTAILIFEDEGGMRYSDVREFVMCGECKHFKIGPFPHFRATDGGVGWCGLFEGMDEYLFNGFEERDNDDFCSRGEPA